MPIYEYKCPLCNTEVTTIQKANSNNPSCNNCGILCDLIPSIPGYRRDRTINE